MLKPLRKLVRRGKQQLRQRRSDRRRAVLLRAGRHLLANADCNEVAVAMIASRAGCSVGAFYGRFPDKGTFLAEVVVNTFDAATETADWELDANRWRDASTPEVVRQIVQHAVKTVSGETAGAMRAALKRKQLNNSALEPVLSYRETVTDRAVALLADRLPKMTDPKRSVRVAMQIVHATVMDALLHDRGPLFSGSRRMIDELAHMMMRHLGLRGDSRKEIG